MDIDEVHMLRESLQIPAAGLVETHISWVLLSEEIVYKIKKPVRFSFLDFSTLEQRRFCCAREVELNRRLTDDMYLGVVAIRKPGDSVTIGSETGEIIDYAVKMRRKPGYSQMDVMLRTGKVTSRHVEQIAEQLSAFHKSAMVPDQGPDPDLMLTDFADLRNSVKTMCDLLGEQAEATVLNAIHLVDKFLRQHAERMRERHARGFFIDGHGDLHSKNIFLLDEPVIYDCIEFNDHFRYVDVLDELAFFCLDLEFYDQKELATHFLDHYLLRYPCMETTEDRELFHYFQLYRAGVKLKINLLRVSESEETENSRLQNVQGYHRLFVRYLERLDGGMP